MEKGEGTGRINLRVSPGDKKLIEARAKSVGKSLSDYTRNMLLTGQIIFIDSADRQTINGIANNLNQLTRMSHLHGTKPVEIEKELLNLIKEIKHAYGKR